LLLDGKTGSPLAMIDGPVLTAKRTAAASALAASYLARSDSERLLMVGTGALAPQLVLAHAAVRPICNVLIWGRSPDKAARLAENLNRANFRVEATDDLEAAARGAHVISCATLSPEPLIQGAWLQPGQHLDLVGGYRPDMRETDDAAIRRARVFVDTRAGACTEAGDIVQPLESGVLAPEDIAADLFELTRGERAGRRFYDQITLFKSVGSAIEDLAAAQLTVERA
jgi:ornithine cyclodeaminase